MFFFAFFLKRSERDLIQRFFKGGKVILDKILKLLLLAGSKPFPNALGGGSEIVVSAAQLIAALDIGAKAVGAFDEGVLRFGKGKQCLVIGTEIFLQEG